MKGKDQLKIYIDAADPTSFVTRWIQEDLMHPEIVDWINDNYKGEWFGYDIVY